MFKTEIWHISERIQKKNNKKKIYQNQAKSILSKGAIRMKIKKLSPEELDILTELFDYNDVEQMKQKCSYDILNKAADIYVLYDNDVLIGELHAKYKDDNENFAQKGKRAYLYAFRVREDFQNKGYGTYLMKGVLSLLKENGYSEFTIGVEDDNLRAIHIYQAMGFNEFLLRTEEEYQGDRYEYNLYLKR